MLQLKAWQDELKPNQYTREERTDVYLYLPGRMDVGIKRREGRLEVKYRIGPPWPKRIAPGLDGFQETWVKYGFELESAIPELSGSPADVSTWYEISKFRKALVVHRSKIGLEFRPLQYMKDTDVQLEYTRLQVLGQTWFTFGLEWPAGVELRLPKPFLTGILGKDTLSPRDSMGYAEFLQHRIR